MPLVLHRYIYAVHSVIIRRDTKTKGIIRRKQGGNTVNFSEGLKTAADYTLTENGAAALNTTGNACLDFFATIGSLRDADVQRIHMLFAEAFKENPLIAVKTVFYARDIREGLGERQTFRTLIRYMAEKHPQALIKNLDLIGVFGRFDDLYSLIGTPLEADMWSSMSRQFEEDRRNLENGCAISLLSKWIKTADASSENTRRLGILTAQKLGYSVYDFKRLVRRMRKRIDVTEALMSAGKWNEIKYSAVPGRAMSVYRDAFMRHDSERFGDFISRALEGKEKINSSTLFPYDIVREALFNLDDSDVLEAQWRQLPDYVEKDSNVVIMADVSGSMTCSGCRPLATAVGLAVYFAERNTGAYHNIFMTFSADPQIVRLKGETLVQKVDCVRKSDWGYNTNLEAAFDKVLDIAAANRVPADEMPKSIIVISDMEIDCCTELEDSGNGNTSFHELMRRRYASFGYDMPNIVFWNVNSRNNVFHAGASYKGVQLCSGQSANVFKQLMSCIDRTPSEMMNSVLNSERYECIGI